MYNNGVCCVVSRLCRVQHTCCSEHSAARRGATVSNHLFELTPVGLVALAFMCVCTCMLSVRVFVHH